MQKHVIYKIVAFRLEVEAADLSQALNLAEDEPFNWNDSYTLDTIANGLKPETLTIGVDDSGLVCK